MMDDFIRRSALIEKIWGLYNSRYNNASIFDEAETKLINKVLGEVQQLIEEHPTVEAKPVVHGFWKFNHFYDEWECSECGSLIALSDDENGHPNFCPNCGADMRKKVQE